MVMYIKDRILKKNTTKKQSWDDRVFDLFCGVFLGVFVLVVFYPIYFILVASFTKPKYVNSGDLLLYPTEFYLE